ncbi:MAG: indolepyruvate ferredoxin oxidoreductase subunit alpha [Synergistales bacterium]|nr:indolepyruvate ferredoxin oxidoreductase subunit alpha [Synergistales bacterium]MDY6401047.1 indolepyruvate ferredoxin oxidoreductase subunit alpha [Synergistales bacterium]MDY6404640.1 indolepyruvate ferredoxin oxidoreductase subunit alpha [Synergistales bacterium]MDY6410944.1 indolepyruvate ferredoxin oxidoreductase subunit alpha [Synergistales bacterium]MDY6415085.1 indolepyruvate ferredoxin oxidoreductase subunit alpha [Synergistales bacterium]
MKQLMQGNTAAARGLYEAGCCVASSYPGTPSTEITEEAAKFDDIYCEWAPNEKVAMETAFGAALAGKRSFCGMKHVGLNVAADPLFTVSYTGINAGMVICVADDPGMHSSQNEQDSRHYARAAKLPMLEPSDSQEALDFFKKAYEISEEFDVPVIVKMCTRVAHSQSLVKIGERDDDIDVPYEKNIAKYVMMPGNAIKRHPIIEERTRKLRIYSDFSKMNKFDDGKKLSIGIITSSTCYQYVKEACGDLYPVFKIGMVWPLPDEKIKEFAKVVKRLIIVEELDPFIEEHCKALGLKCEGKELFPVEGELNQNIIAQKIMRTKSTGIKLEEQLPARPPMMCAGCPHRGIFYTLNKNNCIVLGDIGCYTLGAVAPLSAMDMTLCMGASVSAVHGFNKALENYEGDKKVVAVIGDSTFMHSGMTGLANIAYNQSKSVVIILDNSITGMTGHQQNPTTGFNIKGDPAGKINLENLCRAMGFNRVRVVDPYNLKECEDALKEELASNEASVIISRRPCALLKYVKHNPPLKVNAEKCIGCKSCMKIGCPALSMKDKHAHVDSTLCVGCGVCEQLCKFDAFEGTSKEGE